MSSQGASDAKYESSSSSTTTAGSADEVRSLIEKNGCWCPGYEDHPSKKGVCRNCGHPENEHDEEGGVCKHTEKGNDKDKIQDEKKKREEEKNRARRKNINREILETERSYVEALRKMKVYRTKLEPCLDEKTIWSLFSNSDSLLDLHEDLFSRLEQCIQSHITSNNNSESKQPEGGENEPCFGPIFVSVGPSFRLYKMYAAAHENAVKVIHTIVEKKDALEVCKSIMGDPDAPPRDAILELNSLLIAPIQRIPRYLLLIQDLIKHSAPESSNRAELEKAHKIILDVAGEVNTYVTVEEDMNKVIQIQQTLIGDFPPLYGKRFIHEGDLNKITSKLIIKCHMFLFDDVILYSHAKLGSFWRYKGTIELGTAWVRVLEGGETYKNVFQIVGPKKTWTFYANTPEELNVWLDHLNGAISALVEKDPSLIGKRADVSVKMGRGLWKLLSINRRKDYDKQFSESLKNESNNDEKPSEKSEEKEPAPSSPQPTKQVTAPSDKEETEKQKEKPKESSKEEKSDEVARAPIKSRLTRSGKRSPKIGKRFSNGYDMIVNEDYDEDEDDDEKEEKVDKPTEPKKDDKEPSKKQPEAKESTGAQSTAPVVMNNYSTIISSSAPGAVVMQDDHEGNHEGKHLLGSPRGVENKQRSWWCCC